MKHPRIYADFNGIYRSIADGVFVVPLDSTQTLRDLAAEGIELRDGFALTIYDRSDEEEDLEADAVSRYDAASRRWLAVLDEGYQYVPAKGRLRNS
jgi:hypothetical protein